MTYLGLERLLRKMAKGPEVTPYMGERNLFERYDVLLKYLRSEIYPQIDVGLATLSKKSGFFTLHDGNHFDEVVKMASSLLTDEVRARVEITAYEIFVLLIAIRIHDAGNIEGREDHEKRAADILTDAGHATGLSTEEVAIIAKIAAAHGGVLEDGSKDKIGDLSLKYKIGSQKIRMRFIAAIVRFADELADNCKRTNAYLLRQNKIPRGNEIYHRYAASIGTADVEGDTVNMIYRLQQADMLGKYGKKKGKKIEEVFLIDEINQRIKKMYLEKYYCNQFLRPYLDVRKISLTIEFYTNNYEKNLLPDEAILYQEDGYPDPKKVFRGVKTLTGEEIKNKAEAAIKATP